MINGHLILPNCLRLSDLISLVVSVSLQNLASVLCEVFGTELYTYNRGICTFRRAKSIPHGNKRLAMNFVFLFVLSYTYNVVIRFLFLFIASILLYMVFFFWIKQYILIMMMMTTTTMMMLMLVIIIITTQIINSWTSIKFVNVYPASMFRVCLQCLPDVSESNP